MYSKTINLHCFKEKSSAKFRAQLCWGRSLNRGQLKSYFVFLQADSSDEVKKRRGRAYSYPNFF